MCQRENQRRRGYSYFDIARSDRENGRSVAARGDVSRGRRARVAIARRRDARAMATARATAKATMRARATSTARGRARATSTARAGRAGDARRAGRAARRAEARGALADDLGAEDVLNAMESFCEEEESTRATPKTGGRARRDDVFRGTMDDDAFERLDKQKASRREKRTAVRAVREEELTRRTKADAAVHEAVFRLVVSACGAAGSDVTDAVKRRRRAALEAGEDQ